MMVAMMDYDDDDDDNTKNEDYTEYFKKFEGI